VANLRSKWTQVIADLQHSPGEWQKVADDAGPSTIQRLRELGAEVRTVNISSRTKDQSYSRYTVFARWPTPETERETLELEYSRLTQALATAKADVDAADEEYNSAKKILNRNAYRRKQAREKYEPLLEQHDQLTALLNRLKTEKD
jgi:chromosome segregation ATPase